MDCNYFGVCGSCTLYDLDYEKQVEKKSEYIKELFSLESLEVFKSPQSHYRSRAEFRIWHEDDGISYGMHRLDKKGILKIEECPKVDIAIYNLMPKLKKMIEEDEELRRKLFGVEFLCGESEVLVTLIYHKPINESWVESAKKLQKPGILLIGRSRGVKLVVDRDFVIDSLHVREKEYRYKIEEGSFSQPNKTVNQKMIEWVALHVKDGRDLLEMYCGHGNFTIPLSQEFRRVLATEISKKSISAAKYNCELNGVENIEFVRLSASELSEALEGKREFKRLRGIDLKSFDFSHVFVDPPRAGIDEESLKFISKFENIIYISCNPQTLKRDLEFLDKTHKIVDFAMFDQFPYTSHIESGVILIHK